MPDNLGFNEYFLLESIMVESDPKKPDTSSVKFFLASNLLGNRYPKVKVAASVWDEPDFVCSWSAAAKGLEGIAVKRNDICLILDEVDEASPYEKDKIAYMLSNGQGKQRAGKIGQALSIKR